MADVIIEEPRADEASRADASSGAESVVFSGVGKVFGGATAALSNVDLSVTRGEVFGIIGRSGAGKSTLLRLVNGLEKPSSGEVRVNGISVGALDERGLVALRRRIGMVFQHFNLLSAKTVRENIALPLKIAGRPKREIDAKVDALLELVGLSAKRDAYPRSLSGGQKQRVGIARALVHDPDLLLCDEATSALDPETTQQILALLRDINRRLGLTIVLITHEMAVIREVCDSVAVIEAGEVVETGAGLARVRRSASCRDASAVAHARARPARRSRRAPGFRAARRTRTCCSTCATPASRATSPIWARSRWRSARSAAA